MRRRIVCVGNLVHDEVYRVEMLPASGIKTGVLGYESRFGGPAATAAVAISHLGGQASYWGRLGRDEAGEAALALLQRHGVDCAGVAMLAEGRTLRAIVMVDPRGERSIVSDRRSLSADVGVLPPDDLADVAVVLADTRWPAGAEVALERAAAAGIPGVLDADGGAPDANQRLIARCDHVIFSSEGLRDHAGDGAPADLLRRCPARSGQILAATCGAAGSLWLIQGEIVRVPAFDIVMRDTTGCGDVFHGAYALGIGEGMAPLEAARLASATAALKGARAAGWDGMPDRAAVLELMRSGPTRE